jgi:hypothetical protein
MGTPSVRTALFTVSAVLARIADGEVVSKEDLDWAFETLLAADKDQHVHQEYRRTWNGATTVRGHRTLDAVSLRREAEDYRVLADSETNTKTV